MTLWPHAHRLRLPVQVAVCLLLCLPCAALPAAADEWRDAKKAFKTAQKSEDWQVRRDGYVDLSYHDSGDAVEVLLDQMEDEENPAVVLSGLTVLGGYRSSEAAAALAARAKKGRGTAAMYAIMALEGLQDDASRDVLIEVLGGRDAAAAAQAALALGKRGAAPALPALIEALGAKSWQLQAAAARAIARMADVAAAQEDEREMVDCSSALPALAEALGKAEGVERGAIIRALEVVGGQAYGLDVAAWKKLAAGTDPGSIRPRKIPVPHAFGIPIYGKRLVIVMTNSQRNEDPHRFGTGERLKELLSVPGARPILHTRVLTVGHFIRSHLKRLINDLDGKGQKFDLIVFHTTVHPVFGKLTGVNNGTKDQLREAIEAAKPEAGMNHFDALTQALDISGSKASVAWKSGPDEILFTACNAPNQGELKEPVVVGAAIGLKARLRLVPIHAIGVESHAYEMMAHIARETGGVYLNLFE